jgi:hypothetical protein
MNEVCAALLQGRGLQLLALQCATPRSAPVQVLAG